MGTQFAYTQKHIANTLIPKLINERNALLIDAPDSVTAQSTANRLGKAVYWNQAESDDTKGLKGNYKQIVPKNVPDYSEVDKVEALDLGFEYSDHNPVLMTVTLKDSVA